MDEFPGTILYYYEIKGRRWWTIGLSDDAIPVPNDWIGNYSNSYGMPTHYYFGHQCYLAGERHHFELPEGVIQERPNLVTNVYGCGLVLDPDNNLAIFFTLNGIILGRKIPINPRVDRLFPAVKMIPDVSFEANFGDDQAKPFEYDIQNCPGLELACI